MKRLIIIFLGALLLSTLTFAATQGTLGATSTGTTDISLVVPDLVKISALQDIDLQPTSIPATGVDGSTTACIYSNNDGNYTVTVSGSGTGDAFTVSNGTETIAYTATWNDGSTTSTLTAGNTLSNQSGASVVSENCDGRTNATFAINFAESAIAAAPAGDYDGVATILISPT